MSDILFQDTIDRWTGKRKPKKRCPGCGEVLPLEEFVDGYNHEQKYCEACRMLEGAYDSEMEG